MKRNFELLIPDEKDLLDFGYWAFGEGLYELQNGREFVDAWNKIHGDVLKINGSGLPSEDAPKMVELWKRLT